MGALAPGGSFSRRPHGEDGSQRVNKSDSDLRSDIQTLQKRAYVIVCNL